MKKIIITLFSLILIGGLTYFVWQNNMKPKPNEIEKFNEASLRFGWIPSASFAGEIAGMTKFAKENKINIKCESGGPGLNAIKLVQMGEDTFGTIAADEVLAANDKGADLVIIGVINFYSPGGFVSKKGSGIKTPKDFEGKRIGLLPFGSTTLLYESMLEQNQVNKSNIEEIIISPDLKPFITGNYDVQPVFVYDETVSLERQGIEFNLIEPKNFGVNFKGPVYFCKREVYEKNPKLVEKFIKTMAQGWNFSIENKEEAIAMLKDFAPEINTERELMVLEKAVPYYTAYKNQPLNSDYDSWNSMITELLRQNKLKKKIIIKNIIKLDYIQDFYIEDE